MDPIVHFEIPADDMAAAQTFYETAFGWKIFNFDPAYYLSQTAPTRENAMGPDAPGAINGALMKRKSPSDAPLLVIRVQDMDEAIARVKQAGGSILLPKMSMGDIGFYAQFQDTQNNVLALFQDPVKD